METENTLQAAFLAAYRMLGNVSRAADAAECDRSSHYRWMKDPEYAAQFETAREEAIDRLEGEAINRAMHGSDRLMEFLLKGAKPEKYRENHKVEITGEVDIISRLTRGRARARGEEAA
jgi:hypothetical protein